MEATPSSGRLKLPRLNVFRAPGKAGNRNAESGIGTGMGTGTGNGTGTVM